LQLNGGTRTAKFGVLHKFNPVRLDYIREQVTARLRIDPNQREPFKGLRFLDIGCGGGLLCEPMARLGAEVVGVDASEKNIKTASVHAEEQGLEIDYRASTAEDLAAAGEKFDVILNMEVIEHVADPADFAKTCAGMVKPGGLMFVATLNRTLKAFGLAIIGAEYVLGWLPKGTHQWEKFITPDELKGMAGRSQLPGSGSHRRDLLAAVQHLAQGSRHGRQLHAGIAQGKLSALSSPRPAVWAAAARQCLLRAVQRHP
jgi:2-polyprenyl-6-hydroxyphenyl methylase/3-demethylubiquinone-9 3-methyltransferase